MGRNAKIFLFITFAGALVNFKNCDIFFGMNRIKNERGFLLLNVVFLTLITSFAAMILLNAAPRAKNSQSTIRLIALYLAEEQFAELESAAAVDKVAPTDSTTTKNFDDRDYTIKTEVSNETEVDDENLYKVTVTVSWTDDGKNFSVTAQRRILVAENS